MNTSMHGMKIRSVFWPDTESEQGRCLEANEDLLIELSATYHGDHNEFWIVVLEKIGGEFREVARHNPKFIESLVWA